MQTLIEAAKKIIEDRYEKGKHSVSAAVITGSGKIYYGVCMNSQKLDVCSEWVAIGNALSAGDKNLKMIVSVHRDQEGNYDIYSPCALCRELFLKYAPDIQVVLPGNKIVVAKELLPYPWERPKR